MSLCFSELFCHFNHHSVYCLFLSAVSILPNVKMIFFFIPVDMCYTFVSIFLDLCDSIKLMLS